MYRIYYTHEGEITTVGVSQAPGDYIECDLDVMTKVQQAPQTFLIMDKKLVSKTTAPKKQPKKLIFIVFISDHFTRGSKNEPYRRPNR